MNRRRCCFLSMENLDGYVSDDELAVASLNDLGWNVDTVSWRDPSADWDRFDIVVIRTTWDYQRYPREFLKVLGDIDRSNARLENSLDLVKWNLDKRYLRFLNGRKVPIVPTIWDARYNERTFDSWFSELNTEEIIIKPTVSATAEHTYRLKEFDPDIADVFSNRGFMVQPFMTAIVSEGEYSLFYFDGEFSHAILKQAKNKDFRVQEEHGGLITAVIPEERLLKASQNAADQIGPVPLYMRVDLVRDESDNFLLMELELIEPALYFRTDPASPRRFAEALTHRMR